MRDSKKKHIQEVTQPEVDKKDKLERVDSHKEAGKNQQFSENEWEFTFKAVSDWVVLIDLKGRIIRTNNSGGTFTGLSPAEMIGQSCCKLVHGSEKHIADCPMQEMIRTGKRASTELQLPNRKQWIMVTVDPITDKKGKINQVIHIVRDITQSDGIFRDITERKQAEEALYISEERFKGIFENSLVGIYRTTPDGRILMTNPAIIKMLGYSSFEELAKVNLQEYGFLPEYPRSEFLKQIEEKGQVVGYESVWCKKDGDSLFVRESARAVRDKNGNTLYYEGTVEDITERKKAEDELREERDFQESLVETAQAIILVLDVNGKIIQFNKYMEEISGYSLKEVQGKDWFITFLPECDHEQMRTLFNKAVNDIQTRGNINSIITKSGEERQIEWYDKILKDNNGKVIGLLSIGLDITERIKAKRALQESGTRLQLSIDAAELGIWDWDLISGKITWDGHHAELFGFKEGEFDGSYESFEKKIHPEDSQGIRKAIKIAQDKREEYVFEYRVVWPDETIHWVLGKGRCIYNDEGQAIRMLGTVQNITKRKQAERELKTEHNLLRLLIDNIPDRIFLKDNEHRFILGNSAMVNHKGFKSEDELLGKTDFDLYPEKDAKVFCSQENEIIKKGNSIINERCFYKDKKGNEEWSLLTKVPLRDLNGDIIGLAGIKRNVTEQKNAEDALRESEESFRTFIEQAPEAVFVHDLDGQILLANKLASKYTGFSNEELLNMSVSEIDAAIIEQDHRKKYWEKLGFGENVQIEAVHKRKNGSTYPAEVEIVKILFKNDPVLLCFVRDVAEREKAEQALRESEQLLNEVGRIAKIGGWEMDLITRKAKWTKGTYDIVEIGFDEPIPGPDEHVEYYLPEYRQIVEQAMKKLIEDDITLDFEAKLRTAKGNVKWCRAIGQAVRKDGVCIKVFGTFHDITNRKQAEEAVSKLAKFPEENPHPVLRLTEDGTIIYSNNAGSIILDTWNRKVGERLPEDYQNRVEQVLQSGEVTCFEFECHNGRIFEITLASVSEMGYINIYGLDITQRKYVEDSLLKYHKQLKSLASKLTITEERERYRIATELHDHICQSLAISKIKLETLIHSEIADDICDTLCQVCGWITQVIDNTRSLTFDLSSPILHELGFEKAVSAWLEDEIQRKHNIQTEFYCDHLSKPLDDDVRSLLFRDVRELLINVVKHAHANSVRISISKDANRIRVVVEDDGVGFDPLKVTDAAISRAEFGLFSIRQRLEFLDGHFEIDSTPGKGCKITMLAPLKETEDNVS